MFLLTTVFLASTTVLGTHGVTNKHLLNERVNEQCPPLTVSAILSEALGKGVGCDLQLCDLGVHIQGQRSHSLGKTPPSPQAVTYPRVLVGCHRDECGLREAEGGNAPPVLAAKLGGPHQVYAGLVLVHRVQDQL